MRKGGLTPEDYDYLLVVQDGKCAICGADRYSVRSQRLGLDHDHLLGTNRGLLCFNCNGGLGQFKDNPELLRKAAEYLEAWAEGRKDMAQFRISSGGAVPTSLLDTNDQASKDPGAYAAPEAGPNTPVNTGGAKTVQLTANSTTTSGNQVLASLSNPG